jgi:uncharacterized protein (TIGR00369 family)
MNGSIQSLEIPERDLERKHGEFPPAIAKLLGFTLASAGSGRATIEFEADHRHSNPMGTLHGGVLCDIADAAMGIAYSTTLAPGETFTTVELHINFLRPVWNAKLRAEGRMVRAGKVVGLVECDIFDEQRRLIARASSTCMTLAGARGEDRALPVDLPRYLKETLNSREQNQASTEHSQ